MNRKITIWGFMYFDQKGNQIGAQISHFGPDKATEEELEELEKLKNEHNSTK